MPEVSITVGGRSFEVSCQEGEESYLFSAAKMLDDEALVLSDQIGRMPESRMLLMAGLMLADKTAATEDKVRELEARLAASEGRLTASEAELDLIRDTGPRVEQVEVPIIPPQVRDTLADLAARAEALAAVVEEKTA